MIIERTATPRPPAAASLDESSTGVGPDLAQTIARKASELRAVRPERVIVVGIDGPTAAGKSTLATAVAGALGALGIETWTYQLDWALKERGERETDVAHLRRLGAALEFEGELHMRLGIARDALMGVAAFNRQVELGQRVEQTLVLSDLYSRAQGGTVTGTETLVLKPGMVLLVEGHYTLRTELDSLIDFNVVLLGDPQELLNRKIKRVNGYRSPDDAIHYFRHTDLPSFSHHLARFGHNADLIVDNTDFTNPRVVGGDGIARWLQRSSEDSVVAPRRLEQLRDIPAYVFSESRMVSAALGEIVTGAIEVVIDWDKMVGHYLRVALEEVDDDLETLATRAIERLNHRFENAAYSSRLSHTDALYNVYYRKLPLTLGIEIFQTSSDQTIATILAEIDRDNLRIGIAWEGGVKWIRVERTLGAIGAGALRLHNGVPTTAIVPASGKLRVFLPTQFTVPSFLAGLDTEPVFIGREQENISASGVLRATLGEGGVWIHRFALHREIRFFRYCLAMQGVPSVHVGNYLIAVKTSDAALRQRFREFCGLWQTPIDRLAVTRAGQDAYDANVENEKAAVRAYVKDNCPRLSIKDGAIFGNIFDLEAIDTTLPEIAALLRSPYRILRKRTIECLDQLFPSFTLPTAELWSDVPEGARKTIGLGEFTGLSASIMAELYLWLALRNENAAILGANVYDIRQSSVDARAFLDAAAERSCPIVLQCSLNAVGQPESEAGKTYHGYLQPQNGVEDFTLAARRAARDLYLVAGKRAPLYGIGLDHVNACNDQPRGRAKRFLQHALRSGGVTHVVLDGSDLFQLTTGSRDDLTRVFQRMNEWVLDLMNSPLDTFLRDMEVCISELNYFGQDTQAYVPSTDDIRHFVKLYNDALVARGFAAHIARPKLFISNLGTCHHSNDEVKPWVERSREWRDAVKSDGFVSAVLHGTSHSHRDTLAAATVGCHKVNVAGDFLDTIVANLPLRLSERVLDGNTLPKKMLPSIRSDMDHLSESESEKLYGALKEHCGRVLSTIASPTLSSMDTNYFQYKDFEFSDMQVEAILAQVKRELHHLMPKAPRRLSDARQGYAFAASMIEVPYEEFRGPILDELWEAGIRYFHVDDGDGVFIARRFSGVEKVRYLRSRFPDAIIHAHLMVTNPHYPKDGEFAEIQQYAYAGANAIAIHIRACGGHREAISAIKIIRKLGMRPGIVVETSDPVDESLETLIRDLELDWVVVMGVPIGYGGQVFQYSTLNRISRLHDLAGRLGRNVLVECDGGLNLQNLELCRKAGGQLFSGWSIIKGQTVNELKSKVSAVQRIIANGAHEPTSQPAYSYGWSGQAISPSRV